MQFDCLLTLKTWHWLTAGKPSREAATYLSVLNLIRDFFGALNFCKAFETLQAFEDSQRVKHRKKPPNLSWKQNTRNSASVSLHRITCVFPKAWNQSIGTFWPLLHVQQRYFLTPSETCKVHPGIGCVFLAQTLDWRAVPGSIVFISWNLWICSFSLSWTCRWCSCHK